MTTLPDSITATVVNPVYEPETILKKRLRNGRVEYFIKWKGYPSDDSTWERSSMLPPSFANLIADLDSRSPKTTESTKADETRGFARGLVAEKIVGSCRDKDGQLRYLIKWKGADLADLVPAIEANEKCPAAVINHLEANLDYCDECTMPAPCHVCKEAD